MVLPEQSTGGKPTLSYRQVWKRRARAKAYICLLKKKKKKGHFSVGQMINKWVEGLPVLSSLWNETPKRLCLCHMFSPSCVISMTARHCCIYSAAGNQGPIPGLTAAQISRQVQLRWLALSPPSACVLFFPWVCCLPMWNSDLVGNNAPTSCRIISSLWIPLQNPNKQQQVGLTIVFHGHFLGSSDTTVTPISIS